MKKIFSFLLYSIYALIVLGLVILFIAPPLPGIGSLDVKIVKSGSMEPNIMTGAVVVIKEESKYSLGDVITFNGENSKIPTTHRIVGTEKVDGVDYFISKGDANEERDTNLVNPKNIVGKVILDVPYVGFVLDFARQPIGFALLIGIPAMLIILDELGRIWLEVRRIRQIKFTKEMISPLVITPYQAIKTEEKPVNKPIKVMKASMMDIKPIGKKKAVNPDFRLKNELPVLGSYLPDNKSGVMIATTVLIVAIVSGQIGVGDSLSYFYDKEASAVNNMQADILDFDISSGNQDFTILDGSFDGGNSLAVTINDNGQDIVYKASTDFISGNVLLCDDIVTSINSPFVFSGALTGFNGDDILSSGVWNLDFSLGNNNFLNGDSCVVDLVIKGRLASAGNTDGYVDTESVRLTFNVLETDPVPLTNKSFIVTEEPPVLSDIPEENPDQNQSEVFIEEEQSTEPDLGVETESETETIPDPLPVDSEEDNVSEEEVVVSEGE